MAVTIKLHKKKTLHLNCTPAEAFASLSDIPFFASNYPKVEQLIDRGDNCYRWEMETVGSGKIRLETVYCCKYVSNPDTLCIDWTPVVEDDTTSEISGGWVIEETDTGCVAHFSVEGTSVLPVPRLLKMGAEALAKLELDQTINTCLANLKKSIDG